jgi:hypothetical protein
MQPIAPQKEDLLAASDERNIGARLVQESRRLESALPRSNYEHTSIAEGFEVGVRGRVGYERVVESHELWRNPSEIADSGGGDDALDIELLAVLERDAKTGPVCFDESSATLVDLRDCVALKPLPVGDEVGKRYRARDGAAGRRLIFIEG